MTSFCGDEFVCSFDYKTTMQQSVANDTTNTLHMTLQAKDDVTAELACESYSFEQGYREVDSNLVGGQMTVECLDGYTLQGEGEYTCTKMSDTHASWQPDVNAYCKSMK